MSINESAEMWVPRGATAATTYPLPNELGEYGVDLAAGGTILAWLPIEVATTYTTHDADALLAQAGYQRTGEWVATQTPVGPGYECDVEDTAS